MTHAQDNIVSFPEGEGEIVQPNVFSDQEDRLGPNQVLTHTIGVMTAGFIGMSGYSSLATYLTQEIVNTPCGQTHWSFTSDEDKSKFYHGNIFIYVQNGCDCKPTMTKASIDLATKGSIEQLHNMDRDAGKIYYHHDDCWGATVTIAVGTAEEPGEYYEGDTSTPKSDYKWTVPPNIDQ